MGYKKAFPQIVTYILQKAFFKHALEHWRSSQKRSNRFYTICGSDYDFIESCLSHALLIFFLPQVQNMG